LAGRVGHGRVRALAASGRVAVVMWSVAPASRLTGELEVDAVLARRDQVVHHMDDSNAVPWLEDRGIALMRGHGCLEGERRVRVGELLCEARDVVVIAVGSAAAMPAIPGLHG
jgi:pyruvate/2-oxoglutarate dehydrogenase complex dihydrolipoamide dehydrogenase (E3) component